MESHLANGNPSPAPSSAPTSRPTFEYAPVATPAPAPAPASVPQQQLGTDDSPLNRFLHEVPKTETTEGNAQAASMVSGAGSSTTPAAQTTTETSGLDRTQMAKLRAVARQRARNGVSKHRINEWLIKEGMSESQAAQVVTIASREAESSRAAAVAANRQDMGLAWLEIIGGIVLLIAGLAAGWFVGLFLVPIIDGFRRLGS